jgi:hypothetical protein
MDDLNDDLIRRSSAMESEIASELGLRETKKSTAGNSQIRKWLTREMLNCFSTVLKLSKKKIRRKIVKLNQLLESNLDLYPCKECMNVRLNLSHREN